MKTVTQTKDGDVETEELTISPISRDIFIAEAAINCDVNPDGNYPLGICRHCGKSLGTMEDDKVISFGSFGFIPNVCCEACSQKGKLRIEAEYEKERARRFAPVIPSEFIFWDKAKGNENAMAAARGKFSFSTRRGLILFGASGTCKTRIMWELVKSIAEQPEAPTWAWVDSYDAATTGFPPEAARVDFLFIDDLGNEPTSGKFETALLRLIRKRNDWHKPLFMSTQLTGEQFKARFFQGAAGVAILRRLSERTDKIATGQFQQTTFKPAPVPVTETQPDPNEEPY